MAPCLSSMRWTSPTLRLFLAVVELGSVSKAAVRDGLSQPSATAKLQKLERQLGVQLLDRGPSGSVATPPACNWRRPAPKSSPPRWRWSTGPSAGTTSPGWRWRDPPRRRPLPPGWIAGAGLAGVGLDVAEGDTSRSPRRYVPARRRSGSRKPGAPLGLRSVVVASGRSCRSRGRPHRWFARRRPRRPRPGRHDARPRPPRVRDARLSRPPSPPTGWGNPVTGVSR